MLEEENKVIEISQDEEELNKAIDESMALLPLDDQEQKIIQDIIKAPTQKDLQAQFDLFNINQSKKNALRIIKLNSLLDKVEDQAIERFEKRPDQVPNKELLDYMQVVAAQIDRSQKFIETLKDKPTIKVANQKTEVNIHLEDKESKERVMDAMNALLKQLRNPDTTNDVIDADFTTSEEKTVYNIDTEDDSDSNESNKGEN